MKLKGQSWPLICNLIHTDLEWKCKDQDVCSLNCVHKIRLSNLHQYSIFSYTIVLLLDSCEHSYTYHIYWKLDIWKVFNILVALVDHLR